MNVPSNTHTYKTPIQSQVKQKAVKSLFFFGLPFSLALLILIISAHLIETGHLQAFSRTKIQHVKTLHSILKFGVYWSNLLLPPQKSIAISFSQLDQRICAQVQVSCVFIFTGPQLVINNSQFKSFDLIKLTSELKIWNTSFLQRYILLSFFTSDIIKQCN